MLLDHTILDIQEYSMKEPYIRLYRVFPGGKRPIMPLFMDNSAENELAQLELQLNSLTQLPGFGAATG